MWRLIVTSTLVLGSVLRTQSAAVQPANSGQLVPARLKGVSPDVLIVSLLDGHVVALDQHTGRVVWTFDSGAPLVSAKQSFSSSQGLNVFPGTDGGLYAYHGLTHLNPGLERLPISLPELVESAPSLTADGSIILGSRDSKVFLLDRRTGRSVTTLSNAAEALEDHSSTLGLTMGVPPDQLLALGRQDYVVRSVRMDTKAETWNATFSKMYLIPSGAPGSIKDFLQEGQHAATATGSGPGLHLVVGSDNSLQAFDPHTRLLQWYVEFETPPVAAYRADGRGGNALDPEQAGRSALSPAAAGGGGLVPASAAPARAPVPAAGGGFLPSRKVKGQLAGGTSVLVGALHGSLYALPADHLMLAASPASGVDPDSGAANAPAVMWPKKSGRMPLDITPAVVDMCAAAGPVAAGKQQLQGSGGAAGAEGGSSGVSPNGSNEGGSSALALLDESGEAGSGLVALNPADNGAVLEELSTLTCPQPPLGIHPITVQQGQTVGWLPLAGSAMQATAPAVPSPSPTAWLAGISRRVLWTLLAVLLILPALLYSLWGTTAPGVSSKPALVIPQQQLQPAHGGVQPLALPAPGSTGPGAVKGAASPAGKKKGSKNKNKSRQQAEAAAASAGSASSSNGVGVNGVVAVQHGSDAGSSSSTGSSKGSKAGGAVNGRQQQETAGAGEREGAASVSQDDRAAAADSAATGSTAAHSAQQQQDGGKPLTPPSEQQQQAGSNSSPPPSIAVDHQQQQEQQQASQNGEAQFSSGDPNISNALSPGIAPVPTDSIPPSPAPSAPSPHPEDPPSSAAADAAAANAGGPGGRGAHMLQHRSYVDEDGAVVIGRLKVGPKQLGFGSAGTIVYEGVLDSRPVAVKRLLRQFYNLARKEINVLVVSDEHPNVVRCFAMEEDREFVYLALERCKTSLAQFINDQGGAALLTEAASGAPTPWCMAVLADTAAGLAALHDRQIVHRDLKPHNVLLTESGRAKLSDMGLSKQLVSEQSSFESHGSGGSSGWQAPEQLIAKDGGTARQSRAIDVFSLGCIMFYCLSGGKHPFGEHYERDTNIMRGLCNLTALHKWPEAVNLLSAMLSKQPLQRPVMAGVLRHPFWWSDEQRLQFLVDVSDRVENEDREPDPTLLNALEAFSAAAVGANWGAALDVELIANLGRYRRYDYTCLRDLLRVVRNKRNHFREMPESLQQLMGPLPNGYYRYFGSRFPMLLLAVFFFALQNLSDDPNLAKYFTAPGQDGGQEPGSIFAPFKRPWDSMSAKAARASKLALAGAGGGGGDATLAAAAAAAGAAAGRGGRRNSGSMAAATGPSPSKLGAQAGQQLPPPWPGVTGRGLSGGGGAAAPASPPHQVPVWPPGLPRPAAAAAAAAGSGSSSTPPAPPRVASNGGSLAAADGASSSGQGAGEGGGEGGSGSSTGGKEVVVGYHVAEGQEVLHVVPFPCRPGKQLCEFFVKTGHCKFGEECVFDHPAEYAVPLTEDELPFRPGQPVCTYYYKTRLCKFGPSCKFHHPKLIPILAGSAVLQQQ